MEHTFEIIENLDNMAGIIARQVMAAVPGCKLMADTSTDTVNGYVSCWSQHMPDGSIRHFTMICCYGQDDSPSEGYYGHKTTFKRLAVMPDKNQLRVALGTRWKADV